MHENKTKYESGKTVLFLSNVKVLKPRFVSKNLNHILIRNRLPDMSYGVLCRQVKFCEILYAVPWQAIKVFKKNTLLAELKIH